MTNHSPGHSLAPPSVTLRRAGATAMRTLQFGGVLLLVTIWGILRWTGVTLPIGSFLAVILTICSIAVMAFEFYKSSDIGTRSFRIELALALFAQTVTTAFLTHLWTGGTFYLVDLVIFFVVLMDAFVSPYNSYRAALRNMQAGVNPGIAGDPSD